MVQQTTAAGIRDERLDIARSILVMLVVFGHLIEPMIHSAFGLRSVYMLTYAFHIPALAFVSGMTSSAKVSKRAFMNMALRLLQPLIICQVIYWTVKVSVLKEDFDWIEALTVPYWLLWYLLSLVFWRILLIPLSYTRYAFPICIALALLVGLGHEIGYYFSISRTLVFMPFFLAGYVVAKSDGIPWIDARWAPPAAFSVFVIALLTACIAAGFRVDHKFLYHSFGYLELGTDWLSGMVVRTGLLALSAVLVWSFFVIIPKTSALLSQNGRESLYPYLTHGFLVKLALGFGFYGYLKSDVSDYLILIGAMLMAVALTLLLTWKPVRKIQQFIYMPSNLFAGRASAGSGGQVKSTQTP